MALTNSLGTYFVLGNRVSDLTPLEADLLQTAGAKSTQGVANIIAAATASDDFGILFAHVWLTDATTGAYATVYAATTAIAFINGSWSSSAHGGVFMNFGPYGLICGTTTTATVSVVVAGATATVNFVVQGFRKK